MVHACESGVVLVEIRDHEAPSRPVAQELGSILVSVDGNVVVDPALPEVCLHLTELFVRSLAASMGGTRSYFYFPSHPVSVEFELCGDEMVLRVDLPKKKRVVAKAIQLCQAAYGTARSLLDDRTARFPSWQWYLFESLAEALGQLERACESSFGSEWTVEPREPD